MIALSWILAVESSKRNANKLNYAFGITPNVHASLLLTKLA